MRFLTVALMSCCSLLSALARRQVASNVADLQRDKLSSGKLSEPECSRQTVCVVSSNAAQSHADQFHDLFKGCLDANPATDVIVLGLQDYRGNADALPTYVMDSALGLSKEHRFKLRDQMMLSKDGAGDSHFCYSKFAGGARALAAAGAILGAKVGSVVPIKGTLLGGALGGIGGFIAGSVLDSKMGVGCGGVAVAAYTLAKDVVEFQVKDAGAHAVKTTDVEGNETGKAQGDTERMSWTTLKGTVAMRLGINGQNLVVASTHSNENVRAKKRGSECPGKGVKAEQIQDEMKRVEDFRSGIHAIRSITADGSGVLWAGDFNPRTADVETGCPDFAEHGDIDRLLLGRDVLGAMPGGTGEELTSFTRELASSDPMASTDPMVEIAMPEGEKCPTYNKGKYRYYPLEPQFVCHSPLHGEMYYKSSKPPSWTDRIFRNSAPWLECGELQRVVHQDDHDAVLVSCQVASPAC